MDLFAEIMCLVDLEPQLMISLAGNFADNVEATGGFQLGFSNVGGMS